MKTFALLTALTIWSCITFSQNVLTPTLHLQGADTLFCFTTGQAKEIAKQLSSGDNCKEQINQYEHIVGILDSMVLVKDRQIVLLKESEKLGTKISAEEKKKSEGYKADAESCEKKSKRLKVISKITTGLAIVFLILAIAK